LRRRGAKFRIKVNNCDITMENKNVLRKLTFSTFDSRLEQVLGIVETFPISRSQLDALSIQESVTCNNNNNNEFLIVREAE
jgi:hypothetical protein